ncbi:MAG: S1C family serine protease, partial [Phycisphaerae bacterium]
MQELVCFATRRVVRYAICWAVVLCQASAQAATDGKSTASGEGMALVLAAQEERVKMIERVLPAVVCVEASVDASGGGSGVLIDADGYGLTNFHVVGKMLGERKGIGGLNDGVPYTLEVLGIDPTGDVAMFRLVGRDEFPFVNLGDSDAVALGDQTVAIGNPFSLATDYKPTATYGI